MKRNDTTQVWFTCLYPQGNLLQDEKQHCHKGIEIPAISDYRELKTFQHIELLSTNNKAISYIASMS